LTGIVAVTVFVAVSMTETDAGESPLVCGPVFATHSCVPSGLTARSSGKSPVWMSVSAGL